MRRENTGCRCAVESTPTPENERVVAVGAPGADAMIAGVGAVIDSLLNSGRWVVKDEPKLGLYERNSVYF